MEAINETPTTVPAPAADLATTIGEVLDNMANHVNFTQVVKAKAYDMALYVRDYLASHESDWKKGDITCVKHYVISIRSEAVYNAYKSALSYGLQKARTGTGKGKPKTAGAPAGAPEGAPEIEVPRATEVPIVNDLLETIASDNRIIAMLKAENEALKAENEALKAENASLQAALAKAQAGVKIKKPARTAPTVSAV